MNERTARLGVDVGGTFTDVALEREGRRWTAKVPTTPGAPEEGAVAAIERALDRAGMTPADLGLVIHGTTLATNALIERKGARTAFVTTAGHRDTIEIGTESRFHLYDLNIEKPAPLVPRELRFTVEGRIAADGRELAPLDEAGLRALAPAIRAAEVESLAIGFLHSYADPAHEERAEAILAEALPEIPISRSSVVSPEMREYERFSTTCANAYIKPLMAGYLHRLAARLRAAGADCPLYLIHSGGGLMTVDAAAELPVRLVESGPAGGIVLAAHVARATGTASALAFDMGGTTAKIALIDDGRPTTARSFEVDRIYRFMKGSGLPVRIPVIELVEIGAGGGSIARVDRMRRITVGPDSAGAEPGPACYGRGGHRATVTDADAVLGRFGSVDLAGGVLTLDPAAAAVAVQQDVGEPLGLDLPHAALGIGEIVDEAMAGAARVHCVEAGTEVAKRTLVAFGGAGPVHAAGLARRLGIGRLVVPHDAGVGSAVGFLRAPVAYDMVRSFYQRLSAFDADRVAALLAEMTDGARGVVEPAAPGAAFSAERTAFMRYVGQGHEIPVAVPDAISAAALETAFADAYRALYGRLLDDLDIEILAWRVGLSTRPDDPAPASTTVSEEAVGSRRSVRQIDAAGGVGEVPVYDWAALSPGGSLAGPAVISAEDTSVVVPSGARVTVDGARNLVIDLAVGENT